MKTNKLNTSNISDIRTINSAAGFTNLKPAYYRELLSNNDLCIGLRHNDALIGYIICEEVNNQIEIIALATHPKYARKGFASVLIKRTIEVARNKNALGITLIVVTTNTAAISLYSKMGFNVTETITRHHKENGRFVDVYRMDLVL